jgi:hypothetical protein
MALLGFGEEDDFRSDISLKGDAAAEDGDRVFPLAKFDINVIP